MTKWIKIIGIVLIVLLIGYLISSWVLKQAFGPTSKIITFNLPDNTVIFCTETYNADLHSVSYNVDFKIIDNNRDTIHLGEGTYDDKNWKKDLQLKKIGSFYSLPVKEHSYLKLLLTKRDNNKKCDTILSPQNLRNDSIWKSQTDEIPAWVYTGSSQLDSIKQNTFFVSYQYRIGDYEPWRFYTQTIEHELDTISGKLRTKKIFERQQK